MSKDKPVNRNSLKPLEAEQAINPHILCELCTAACCRKDMILSLSEEERDTLTTAGTKLNTVAMSIEQEAAEMSFLTRILRRLGAAATEPERRHYHLQSACGLLDDEGRCTIFGMPQRPRVCEEFPRGGRTCLGAQVMRIERGEDLHDPWNDSPEN